MIEDSKLLRALLDSSTDAIHVLDPATGRFLDVNQGSCRTLGYTYDEHLALTVFDVAAGLDRAQFDADVARAKAAGHLTVNGRHRRKDGSVFPVEANLTPVTLDRDYLVVVVARDMTARKQAAAAQTQLAAIVSSSDDAIIGKHVDGTITSWNRGAETIFGYAAAEVVGRPITMLFPPERVNEERELLARLARGERVSHFDTVRVRKDGKRIDVSVTLSPVTDDDGRIVGVSKIARDISQGKRIEQALRESEQRYQALFNRSRDPLFLADLEGRFLDANPAALDLLGYQRREIRRLKFESLLEPEQIPVAFKAIEDIKAAGHQKSPTEFRLRRKDGGHVVVETMSALLYRDGQPVAIQGIARDITGRKRSEERLTDALNFNLAILRNSPMGILVYEASGACVSANEAAAAIIGCTREQALQQNFRQLESWRRDGLLEMADAALATLTERTLEAKLTSSFGRLTWLNCRFVPFDYAKAPHLMLMVADITERKQAEDALRANEAFLNTVIESIPHLIFVKDAKDLRFVKFNKAGEALLGFPRTELLGKNDYDFFPKEQADHFTANDRAVLRGKVVVDIPAEPVQTRHQGERLMHTKKIPVFDSAGRPLYLLGISEDITDHRQAEKKLRQLSQAVEQSPLAIVITNPAGQIEYVNPRFTQTTGYSAAEALGQNPRLLKSGQTPPEAYTQLWQTITSGKDWHGEFHNRKKNGELFWELAAISPILDERGQITHFLAFKEDITEVKLAREKLRQREAFLSAIAENQPGLLWLKDADGRFLTVNRAFAAACGRGTADEVQGLTDFDLWPKALAEKYRADDERVMSANQSLILEEEVLTGGRRVWHETSKSPVHDDQGRVTGTTGFALDITGRKQAEQQLLEAFSFNHKIIADASVGIVAFKASGQCVLANEAAAHTLGATVSKLLAQDFRKIASWRGAGLLRHAEEALAAKAPRQCEANLVSSFGKAVSLVCHFSPFVQNGEPHLLLVFTDVTEQKKLEAQFLRAQRMESIGTLAGGIAHDLNNVLAPLLISIHLLREKITDADGRDLLAMLETNVNRGSDLVKQVLAFGRGIQGERVPVQLKHLARNMKQIVQETFPKSVRLETDIAHGLWPISGDATQIEQVLLNLCVNARDAMPAGGNLSLGMENQMLDARYAAANLEAKPGRYVVVTVADTGQGIPREIQDRIFEPFFTTKEEGKGTGLGLSTSLAIIRSHGGFIHCYSEPGRGSVFKVYLPAAAAAAAEPAPAAKPRLPRGGNELILVVDDEAPIRNLARQILERFGYRVLPAANGAEAVALYKTRGPEIAAVLTDMAMPVMDGPAAIAALQAIHPGVKIIGSSGLDSGITTSPGVRHFIRKPYTAEALLNELHDLLRETSGK